MWHGHATFASRSCGAWVSRDGECWPIDACLCVWMPAAKSLTDGAANGRRSASAASPDRCLLDELWRCSSAHTSALCLCVRRDVDGALLQVSGRALHCPPCDRSAASLRAQACACLAFVSLSVRPRDVRTSSRPLQALEWRPATYTGPAGSSCVRARARVGQTFAASWTCRAGAATRALLPIAVRMTTVDADAAARLAGLARPASSSSLFLSSAQPRAPRGGGCGGLCVI